MGLAADVGSLNRLPHVRYRFEGIPYPQDYRNIDLLQIIGNHSWLREVALTARHFGAKEALEQGRALDTRLRKWLLEKLEILLRSSHFHIISRLTDPPENIAKSLI